MKYFQLKSHISRCNLPGNVLEIHDQERLIKLLGSMRFYSMHTKKQCIHSSANSVISGHVPFFLAARIRLNNAALNR